MDEFTKFPNHKEMKYLHQLLCTIHPNLKIRKPDQGENLTNVDQIANFEVERTPNGKR